MNDVNTYFVLFNFSHIYTCCLSYYRIKIMIFFFCFSCFQVPQLSTFLVKFSSYKYLHKNLYLPYTTVWTANINNSNFLKILHKYIIVKNLYIKTRMGRP
jgi:hypothetical protein